MRPVHWPQLGRMDERTPDGRLLQGEGGGSRALPRPFYAQFDNDGHDGAKLVGSVDEVTLHSNGDISGWGWVLDDPNGHDLVRYNTAGALRHNSFDLADVEIDIKWGSEDPNDEGFFELEGIDFTKWNVGATTAVGMPAFPDATFEFPETDRRARTVRRPDRDDRLGHHPRPPRGGRSDRLRRHDRAVGRLPHRRSRRAAQDPHRP